MKILFNDTYHELQVMLIMSVLTCLSGTQHCACLEKSSMLHSNVIMTLIIWCAGLTIFFLTYVFLTCCRCSRVNLYTSSSSDSLNGANKSNKWVENVRETTREYNAKGSGMKYTASPTVSEPSVKLSCIADKMETMEQA